MGKISVTWKKSTIGYSQKQRRIIESLGLRKLNHTVVHEDTDSIIGMLKKVGHLVEVTEAK
ncbi:MAG: 50S ribosomal protein L30 [SAR202 cluster bacterium]|jgi:large subunit ribosomal protein L30|nr:MAG: 50S ribosomal protein L30 [SAR202 cluster bacterium]MAR85745.1 50S ribosomal protein L30 [Chloroflexota bacterium]KAA1301622.1 MAG: 50S ribosomal protein L30 [SAR202 cluster bacterium]MEC7734436.1 50S ribosomal protein L30 [Chloroflexota bacterium]MED5409784.1 50S ribosomal protein L30 [Chloroflexota bacterium]|tara:strand:+ start:4067 stop:4249 length:183 start_codon:yes stop_codon:yes gene_type:complete